MSTTTTHIKTENNQARTEQSRRIPALRFKEFEGDWTKERAGELCDCIVPGRNKPKQFDGDIAWITTPDIIHNSYIFNSKSGLGISKEEAKSVGSKIVPKNSVIISCVGDLGIVAIAGIELVINQQLHAFLPSEKVEYRFLMYSITTQGRYIDRVATKTAVPYMNKTNCNSIPVYLPSLPEQQKIASFLSAVDTKIQQLTKKQELLEQYKKGVMQQLFSGELRFKDADGNAYPDWENTILGDCLDYLQPTKFLVSSTEYDDSYETPVLTAGKTFILGYTNEKENICNNYPLIIFDDFTTASQYVNFPFKAKSSAMKLLIAKKGVDIKFMCELMQNIKFEIGGHGRHWISIFSQLVISVPSIEEQQRIATCLSSIDTKIESVTHQITQTQTFKNGLLQQMFV